MLEFIPSSQNVVQSLDLIIQKYSASEVQPIGVSQVLCLLLICQTRVYWKEENSPIIGTCSNIHTVVGEDYSAIISPL